MLTGERMKHLVILMMWPLVVCIVSQNGWTALALASLKEHLEVAQALKDAGART